MNRRVRFEHKSYANGNQTQPFLKYLKPGALAQIRNSRINARFYRVNLLSQIQLHQLSSPISVSDRPLIDMINDFSSSSPRIHSPKCLKRKKFVAFKSTWFAPPNLQNETSDLNRDSIVDVFNSDVSAH